MRPPRELDLYGKWLTLSGQRWLIERRRVKWFAEHPGQKSLEWLGRGPGWFGKMLIRLDGWEGEKYWRYVRATGHDPRELLKPDWAMPEDERRRLADWFQTPPGAGEGAAWAVCGDCRRRSWCLREDDGLTYCADGETCERRLRRQPRYWPVMCRMRWRELVTYPREARRQQLPEPWEHGTPPWAREGGDR